jgi:hypothetical protein
MLFIGSIATTFAGLPNVGIKLGANFSKLSTNLKEMKTSLQPGVDAGVFVRVPMKKWYLQPEALYSFRSYKFYVDDVLGKDHEKFKMHLVTVPVLVGYKLLDVKLMNLRVFAGPEFGFILNSNKNTNYAVEKTNIAGNVGLGIDFAMLTFDLKYSYTFNKAIKSDLDYSGGTLKTHDNMFAISIGWKFL